MADTDSIHVVARIEAQPQAVDEVRAGLQTLVAATRQEPGCVAYDLHQDRADPAVFFMVEQWTDAASLDAHMVAPAFQAAGGTLGPLLAAPLTINRLARL